MSVVKETIEGFLIRRVLEELFHFHENPNQKCLVGKNIHHVLDKRLLEVQRAMEEKLSEMTLADVKKDFAVYTEKK